MFASHARRLAPVLAAALAVLPALLQACQGTQQGDAQLGHDAFAQTVRRVVVEVDAAPGTHVHFARLPSGTPPWDITRVNLEQIFGGDIPVHVPRGPAEVGELETGLRTFTSNDLLDLAEIFAQPAQAGELRFHVMFLRGVFVDEAGIPQPEVAAAHVAGTRVLAVFENDSGNNATKGGAPSTPEFAAATQQAKVLHEIGHALGLVNLTIPSVRQHQKPGEPGHCAVSKCVMAEKGAPGAQVQALLHPELKLAGMLLFGPLCLEDIAAQRDSDRAQQ